MKKYSLLLLIMFALVLKAEDRSKWTEISGKYSWTLWKLESGWQNIEKDHNFSDDEKAMLSEHNDIEFILFTAAWCPDSRVGTPKVIALLEKTGHYPKKFQMYGLDREKNEPAGNNLVYKIEKVPTLIILRNNEEIGRIVEYPEKSWEVDILKIIEQK